MCSSLQGRLNHNIGALTGNWTCNLLMYFDAPVLQRSTSQGGKSALFNPVWRHFNFCMVQHLSGLDFISLLQLSNLAYGCIKTCPVNLWCQAQFPQSSLYSCNPATWTGAVTRVEPMTFRLTGLCGSEPHPPRLLASFLFELPVIGARCRTQKAKDRARDQ